jgi:predicted N-acyltransferase
LTAALEWARSENVSSVHLLHPPAEEAPGLEEQGFALRPGVQYQWRNQGYRSLEDFLGRFRSHRRTQLKRELRAPQEQGFTLRTLAGEALSRVDPAAFGALFAATADKYVYSRRMLTPQFFELILEHWGHRLEAVEARRGEELVAGALNVVTDQVFYGRYWGALANHPFLHFNVCLYHPIQSCIERGLERFEPGAGGEHKLVRGCEPVPTWSAHWIFDPALDRGVRSSLSAERVAFKQGLLAWRAETGFKDG